MRHEDFTSGATSAVSVKSDLDTGWYAAYAKRTLDLTLAVLLLPILVPVIALLWALTRRDGAPGMFGHKRVGLNGEIFKCYKIRTMVPDAETKLASYLEANTDAAAEWHRSQKLTNDPRVTRFGQFLRKTSLDELPQIWNVLRGDMSLVGPRPVTEAELERYGIYKRVYLSMRPGITGIWQVSGRNDVEYDERVQMDVHYRKTMSFAQDTRLMLYTARCVVRPTGM